MDVTKFYQYKENVLVEDSIDINTSVCRYMSLSKLLHILDNRFYVSLKCGFSDKRESAELYNPFIKYLYIDGVDMSKDILMLNKKNIKERKEISSDIYASCWSLEKNENFLMWKSYAPEETGVLIESSIKSIIESLEIDDYELYVGRIKYRSEDTTSNLLSYLFSKEKFYKNEKELRIYFNSKHKQENSNAIILKCNPELLIKNITFSPCLDKRSRTLIENLLICKYGFLNKRVKPSKIIEN